MRNSHYPTLAPMLNKLKKRSPIALADEEAILGLPHWLAKIEAGAYLVREGDRPDNCCLLLSGFAYRSKNAGSGARQILAIQLRGDLVDLQNAFLGQADHNVQALTQAEVAFIPCRAILKLGEGYPVVARALWLDMLVDASVSREWLLNVGQRNARQRVAHLLCELAWRQEAAGVSKRQIFECPMTQEQIGDATGLTGVHVNRTIKVMRDDGLISITGRTVTITDWAKLQAAGDFSSTYLHQPQLAVIAA